MFPGTGQRALYPLSDSWHPVIFAGTTGTADRAHSPNENIFVRTIQLDALHAAF